VAFLAGVEGRKTIFLDDEIISYGPGWIVGWPLAVEGGSVACRLVQAQGNKECIGLNGVRGEEFDRVGSPVLRGGALAFRSQLGVKSFIVAGGRRGPEFDLVTDPALSADGTTVAYAGLREGRWILVHGDRRRALDQQPMGVFLSDDGRAVGLMYADHVGEGSHFDWVGRPVFGPDGRMAYAAERAGERFMVVDDHAYPVQGRVSDPVFHGSTIGYGAQIDREFWWKILRP
jgi:hypothetical protein